MRRQFSDSNILSRQFFPPFSAATVANCWHPSRSQLSSHPALAKKKFSLDLGTVKRHSKSTDSHTCTLVLVASSSLAKELLAALSQPPLSKVDLPF